MCISNLYLGDSNTGKTSFVRRVCEPYTPTIGVDFVSYRDGKLKIWDTAGQERFHSIVSHYFRLADICLIFYACDAPETYESVKRWRSQLSLTSHAKVYTVGCKSDTGKYGEADIFISNVSGEGIEDLYATLILSAETEKVSLEITKRKRDCCYR